MWHSDRGSGTLGSENMLTARQKILGVPLRCCKNPTVRFRFQQRITSSNLMNLAR